MTMTINKAFSLFCAPTITLEAYRQDEHDVVNLVVDDEESENQYVLPLTIREARELAKQLLAAASPPRSS